MVAKEEIDFIRNEGKKRLNATIDNVHDCLTTKEIVTHILVSRGSMNKSEASRYYDYCKPIVDIILENERETFKQIMDTAKRL